MIYSTCSQSKRNFRYRKNKNKMKTLEDRHGIFIGNTKFIRENKIALLVKKDQFYSQELEATYGRIEDATQQD